MQLVVCYARCLCASAGLPASLEVTRAYRASLSIYGFQISTYGFQISTHSFQISTNVFQISLYGFQMSAYGFLDKNSNGHMESPYLDRHIKGHTKNSCGNKEEQCVDKYS